MAWKQTQSILWWMIYFRGNYYWIGLYTVSPCNICNQYDNPLYELLYQSRCLTCRNNWRWLNGEAYNYNNWFSSDPDQAVECGATTDLGRWIDHPCTEEYRYVCKARGMSDIKIKILGVIFSKQVNTLTYTLYIFHHCLHLKHETVWYCTLLSCLILHTALLFDTAHCSLVWYCTLLSCLILHTALLFDTAHCSLVWYCTLLSCLILHTALLFDTAHCFLVWYCTLLSCLILHTAFLFDTAHCSLVWYCTLLSCLILHTALLFHTAHCFLVWYCTLLSCLILHTALLFDTAHCSLVWYCTQLSCYRIHVCDR